MTIFNIYVLLYDSSYLMYMYNSTFPINYLHESYPSFKVEKHWNSTRNKRIQPSNSQMANLDAMLLCKNVKLSTKPFIFSGKNILINESIGESKFFQWFRFSTRTKDIYLLGRLSFSWTARRKVTATNFTE